MNHPHPPQRLLRFAALWVILHLVFVQAMAFSGPLHECCHHDADDPGHQCAVTMILSGSCDLVVPDLPPVEIISEEPTFVPDLRPAEKGVVATHLLGGILAQSPPRGP